MNQQVGHSRRDFLRHTLHGATALGAANAWGRLAPLARAATAPAAPMGKADHCIFLWLGGGMAGVDTFDPKRRGDPKEKKPGCYYDSIDTAVAGVKVVEHLPQAAQLMDRITAVRTISHNTFDEHATATHFVHTGRRISETIRYPSIGSIVSHERGKVNDNMPAYVVIGYPNTARDPGFLGPRHGYLNLVDTEAGPSGLVRHSDVDVARQDRREQLLKRLRQRAASDSTLAAYDQVIGESLRLAGPQFMRVFNLKEESDTLRESYGGEFGQRCLLARRLVEHGCRFIEVSHNLNFINGTGWDTHNEGQLNQHLLIKELDLALSTLIRDLESRKMLDRTLIAIATEFGRPPEFDARGGRGHQSKCYTMVLAGGGLKHCGAYGETDEIAKTVVTPAVSIPDFHATICAAMGINPAKELFDENKRPVPITDGGTPIGQLFA
ncbi:MAG: DUF1501 domain-containing protein [Planctomycetes bacterium]|nr:DUF1501 domain-containing protein [Planctomycetota bacterium]